MERAANRNALDISLLENTWTRSGLRQHQQGSLATGHEGIRAPYFSLQGLTPLSFHSLTPWTSVPLQTVVEPADRNTAMKRITSQIRNGIAGQWTQPVWMGELRYVVPSCLGLPLEYGSYTTALARAAVSGGLGSTRAAALAGGRDRLREAGERCRKTTNLTKRCDLCSVLKHRRRGSEGIEKEAGHT